MEWYAGGVEQTNEDVIKDKTIMQFLMQDETAILLEHGYHASKI
jgi:hypothetical protein